MSTTATGSICVILHWTRERPSRKGRIAFKLTIEVSMAMPVSAFRSSLAAFALAAAPAWAQAPAPSPSPSPEAGPRVVIEETIDVEADLPAIPPAAVTTFKLAVPVQQIPASVSVVPRAVLDSQDAAVLGDALKNVSGVSVGTGFGVFDFFTIRGFDSLSTSLVLTDGAFEPESAFYPMYNVRQVEVVKGPAAFLYGGQPALRRGAPRAQAAGGGPVGDRPTSPTAASTPTRSTATATSPPRTAAWPSG